MAIAKECDICGNLYKFEASVVNTIRITYEDSHGILTSSNNRYPGNGCYMDVCPACANAFVALYNSRRSLNG